MGSLSVTPLPGIGEIQPGDNLAQLLSDALHRASLALARFDVLVVAQKAVSKAENRYAGLTTVAPSQEALRLSQVTGKDPRLIELVLAESTEVLRAKRDVLIVRHRLGYVMANAGIDRSNVPGVDRVLLLPENPDASAAALRSTLTELQGVEIGVIVCDSFGRPWRKGVTHVALGSAGLPALIDRRGELDRDGRRLEVTEVALADQIACAAGLIMGEAAEGIPAVLVRGLSWSHPDKAAAELLRPLREDLFR